MLYDASGHERNGIEVKSVYLFIVPRGVHVASATESLVELLSAADQYGYAKFYQTVRDLMLAGF